MIPIRLLFSLSVACSLLLTISITSVPEQNNVERLRRTNRAIPDGLQDPYAGNDQTQEVIDNHHDVNSDLNTPKDVLHGGISAGKGARHEETMDSTENHTTISKVICKACNCSSSFDKSCFECCNATESHAKVASVGIAETHQDYVADSGTDSEENAKLRPEDNANFSFDKYSEIESKKPSVILDSNAAMKKVNVSSSHAEIICDACNCKKPFNRLCFQLKCCSRKEHERSAASSNSTSSTPAPNETVVTEDSEKNVTNNAIDLSKLKDHEENANFTLETHSEIVSEKPLPSKPATFDSDESNETGPVSNSSSTIFNSWTVIFICIITLTSLISAFKYAKQWRRNRMREDYLIDGLYSEARPLCLNDVLD